MIGGIPRGDEDGGKKARAAAGVDGDLLRPRAGGETKEEGGWDDRKGKMRGGSRPAAAGRCRGDRGGRRRGGVGRRVRNGRVGGEGRGHFGYLWLHHFN